MPSHCRYSEPSSIVHCSPADGLPVTHGARIIAPPPPSARKLLPQRRAARAPLLFFFLIMAEAMTEIDPLGQRGVRHVPSHPQGYND